LAIRVYHQWVECTSSAVLGYFSVMLRQASCIALVEYEKRTLPQQKIRLPCLAGKFLQLLRFKI